MGSPPAPHLANGWLSSFDRRIQADSVLYFRYMDDILCSIAKNKIDERLMLINNLHASLAFTSELENDSKLPFLDMYICNNKGLLTSC